MKSLRVSCPAKINLFLRVLGVRADGYHELETLFQAVDLQDELIMYQGFGECSLEVPGYPHLETQDNMVMRALRWIERQISRPVSVRMTLIKRIPEAAGLGGGSSNAAAALSGIAALLKLDLSPEDLRRGALALGADVPFFLLGGTAVGEGIGERLTWVDLPVDYGLLLVNPGFPVSTGMIFREYSKTLTGQLREGTLWRMIREKRPLESFLHNDLQVVAERLYPEISEMCARLVGFGIAASLMTGSGPTVFGIGDPDRLDALKRQLPGQWLRLTARPVKRGVAID